MNGAPYDPNDADPPPQLSEAEDQQAEMMVSRALAAIESGQQPEGVFNALLAGLPAHLQNKIRGRVNGELEKRKTRRQEQATEHQKQLKEQKERGQGALKTFTMAIAARLIGQQTLQRITALMGSRPDISQAVRQAGMELHRQGVQPDTQAISEEALGRMSPSVTQGKGRETERGIS